MFADDLNAFQSFSSSISDDHIREELKQCQQLLHLWGSANQVIFDPAKESFHILHPRHSSNDTFKMLGIKFDTQLKMEQCICEIAAQGHSRIAMILRCRKLYPSKTLLRLYEQFVLSGIEFATPAIYHATEYALSFLERVQQQKEC